MALFSGQATGQSVMDFPSGLIAEFAAQPFERVRSWNDDPPFPAGLHRQRRQVDETVVFDRLRQQDLGQFCRRSPAERMQAELTLTFDGMMLAVPLRRKVCVDHLREDLDLLSDECKQCSRRAFASPQGSAGVAQVAEHESVAEAIVIAAGAPDCCKVRIR